MGDVVAGTGPDTSENVAYAVSKDVVTSHNPAYDVVYSWAKPTNLTITTHALEISHYYMSWYCLCFSFLHLSDTFELFLQCAVVTSYFARMLS